MIVGDQHGILIPNLSPSRRGPGRLKGVRCIHTHLGPGSPDQEDLTDLALLRLDGMVVIETRDGNPGPVHFAHLLPSSPEGKDWEIMDFRSAHDISLPFLDFIQELEGEIQKGQRIHAHPGADERGILVHASALPKAEMTRSLKELAELARSANVVVLETFPQRIVRYNPAYLIGRGKLQEILMKGLSIGATMAIFDQELSPAQANNIAALMDLKVIDRTQLILDIFARRARSREGRIQVELAQLRYILPRLTGKGIAMSRLMGGIGGKGPGETKLEVDRRRIKDRIRALERDLEELSHGRRERRKRRKRREIPVVSLVGYTNAGKSTLLNRLTGSTVVAEDKLFATLDPTTRHARLPDGGVAIFADTVGFIRHMPKDLRTAFEATLEELEDTDLFVHVVDRTSPYLEEEIRVVEDILEKMGLEETPRILAYNKCDIPAGKEEVWGLREGIDISALTGKGIGILLDAVSSALKVSQRPRTENPWT